MSKKGRNKLLGYLIILITIVALFREIGWIWFWAVLSLVTVVVLFKAIFIGREKSPAHRSRRVKRLERGGVGSKVHRDYGRESMADSRNKDVLKGMRLVCTLDEQTCLKCLKLDGTKNPPKLPIHEGCRCVIVPITKSWAELGANPKFAKKMDKLDSRIKASAIGCVGEDGGIYKSYLIERATAIEKGLDGEILAQHLKTVLSSLKKRYSNESDSVAKLEAKIFALHPSDDFTKIKNILENLNWPSDEFAQLFKQCAKLQKFELIDSTLRKIIKQVSDGPFAARHKGMIYRDAGNSVKKESMERAVEYYEQAEKIDQQNTAVMMELGKLYRQTKRIGDSKKMFTKILQIKPNHKGAKKELAKF